MTNISLSLERIAELVAGKLIGDRDYRIDGVAPLDQADDHQISFAEKGASLKHIGDTAAAAVLVPGSFQLEGRNVIQVENPRLAFAKVVALFHPPAGPRAGVHPSAVVGAQCELNKDVAIAAGVVLGDRVVLGERVQLHPNVVVGDDVTIGDDTCIYPNAVVMRRCKIGRRVIVHSGSVIGSDGFGFVFDKGRWVKMPQIGIVQIDDDVEIGANNTIDRATMGRTWIKSGVKTDDLVHIAHNVEMGEHSVIVAHVGIAGSTTIGRHAVIAGQAGVGGHLKIGDQVTIGPQCAVAQSVPDKQVVSSTILAMPHRRWLRLQKVIADLPELFKRVKALEKKRSGGTRDKS